MNRTVVIGGYTVTVAQILRDALVVVFVVFPAFVVLMALAYGMEPVR